MMQTANPTLARCRRIGSAYASGIRSGLAPAIAAVLVLVSGGAQALANPAEFPLVALTDGGQARYVALAMDAWKSRVAYVVFDGTLNGGYRTAYVWIPDDPKYGRPVALTSADGSRFGPFELRVENGDEVSRVTWLLSARKLASGGTHEQFDYATGETRTITTEARESMQFNGSVNLGRGDRLDMVGTSDYPLDITIDSGLPVAVEWGKVGAPLAPWEQVDYRVHVKAETAGEQGRLLLKGVMNAKVRSLPEDARVEVKVSPYREDPIASEAYNADALAQGVSVPAPYGWYTVWWKLDCEWLGGRLTGTTGVFPVSKPVVP